MDDTAGQEGGQRGIEVLEQLIDRYPEGIPLPDRITIEQGTATQWACRVYHPGGVEFDGVIINLDEDA